MLQKTDIIDPKTAATISGLFQERVRRTPGTVAYQSYSEKNRCFEGIRWQEVSDLAGRWQAALKRENLQTGDRVAVIMKNCLEWALFDLASQGLGLVTVPLYANDRPSNIVYILKETGARFVLIENEAQWKRIEEIEAVLPDIKRVVTLCDRDKAGSAGMNKGESLISELSAWLPEEKPEHFENLAQSGDLATIVYTSGTTGTPKGVMLSHANILENAFACLRHEPVYCSDQFLSFLPLSHTFERTVGYYIPMMAGASVAYVRSIDKLADDIGEIRPTVLISVPRIYERIHKKIAAGLEEKSALARGLFNLTVHTGWRRFLYRQERRMWTPLFFLWPLLERIMAKRLINLLGGRLRLSISGGAPLEPSIARVFIGLGLNFLQGYGLTETSPVISFNTSGDNIPSTVGRPLPDVEVAIADNGELCVRGPNVMLGYWHNREASDAAIDADGFLHTGDLAQMDDNGHISIVGRIKEIIVLSNGEKVPPGDLELAIAVHPLFEQVMVVGEGRPFLAALVVLNHRQWEKLCTRHRISTEEKNSLSGAKAEEILLAEIARMISRFPGYAKIRRVHAALSPWTLENDLITTTLKLRRKKLLERFNREVEELFKGH